MQLNLHLKYNNGEHVPITSNHELLRIRSSTVSNRFYIILNAYAINKIYMQTACVLR